MSRKPFRSEKAVATQMRAIALAFIAQQDMTVGDVADRVGITTKTAERVLGEAEWEVWMCWRMWDGLGLAGPYVKASKQ